VATILLFYILQKKNYLNKGHISFKQNFRPLQQVLLVGQKTMDVMLVLPIGY